MEGRGCSGRVWVWAPSIWVGSLEEGGGMKREEFERAAVDKTGRDACEDQGNRRPDGSGTQRRAGVGTNYFGSHQVQTASEVKGTEKSLRKQAAERGGPPTLTSGPLLLSPAASGAVALDS